MPAKKKVKRSTKGPNSIFDIKSSKKQSKSMSSGRSGLFDEDLLSNKETKEDKKLKSVFEAKLSKSQKKELLRTTSRRRISTGIKKLDSLLQGGYKESSINLVEGGPGSGKTIFSTQFLVEGIKRGEPVAYITFEVNKSKYYEDMKAIGWDLEKYEKDGLFTFLAYTPEQIKRILVEGGGTIDTIITKRKIKRLVIDSITSFALLYGNELAKKEAALTLFSVIDTWQCTALLTAQSEEGDSKGEMISAALDFEVDGIIVLYHLKEKGLRRRGLEILKMRGTKIPNKLMDFDVGKGGLILKSSTFKI